MGDPFLLNYLFWYEDFRFTWKTHNEARNLVEEFVLSNETPIKIITGNSHKMKVIVKEVMEKYEMYYFPEHFSNFGAYIIQDKTINESIYG